MSRRFDGFELKPVAVDIQQVLLGKEAFTHPHIHRINGAKPQPQMRAVECVQRGIDSGRTVAWISPDHNERRFAFLLRSGSMQDQWVIRCQMAHVDVWRMTARFRPYDGCAECAAVPRSAYSPLWVHCRHLFFTATQSRVLKKDEMLLNTNCRLG